LNEIGHITWALLLVDIHEETIKRFSNVYI